MSSLLNYFIAGLVTLHLVMVGAWLLPVSAPYKTALKQQLRGRLLARLQEPKPIAFAKEPTRPVLAKPATGAPLVTDPAPASVLTSFMILNPFSADRFMTSTQGKAWVTLEASAPAEWFADDLAVGTGARVLWQGSPGIHIIRARLKNQEKTVQIVIQDSLSNI